MSQENKTYSLAGLMSGTSLDGLDICVAEFFFSNEQWNYKIVSTETLQYSEKWKKQLENAPHLSGLDLVILDREYGTLLGSELLQFLKNKKVTIDLVASHGHTVFHQIDKKLSFQIGHGAFVSAACGIKTISDFRSLDTAYGGQGAPLVPVAEKYLFPKRSCFLNIGGIANLSIHQEKSSIIGFDVCPANQVLNYICQKGFDKQYDEGGIIAASGLIIESLMHQLSELDFYSMPAPKSLGREFTEENILPLLDFEKYSCADLLHTYNHHIADQIHKSLMNYKGQMELLVTGGGAYNTFLMNLLKKKGISIVDTSNDIIEYKEALCFCLLGLLRYLELPNVYSSVSGSQKDNSGGSIFLP